MAVSGDGRAVFLDKDGTLVQDVPHNVDPSRIRLMPGAVEGLRLLQGAGYRLVAVSNQSGLARGYFQEDELFEAWKALQAILRRAGLELEAFYHCPHLPVQELRRYEEACTCRKPEPGLLFRAADELGLDLERCWLIGDILDDVEAGLRAGCRTVLLCPGGRVQEKITPERTPDWVAVDLAEAARMIRYDDCRCGSQRQAVATGQQGRQA